MAGDPSRSCSYLVYEPLVPDYGSWKYLAFNAKGKLLMINRYRNWVARLKDDKEETSGSGYNSHEHEEEIMSGSDEEIEESSDCASYEEEEEEEEEEETRVSDYSSDENPNGSDEEIHYPSTYNTSRFRIFGLNEETRNLEEIDSLEDEVLFLGDNQSLCLSSTEFSGCEGDCVYFTDDRLRAREDPSIGAHDIGVFSLKDGCVERFMCTENEDDKGIWPPPVWVVLASSMIK